MNLLEAARAAYASLMANKSRSVLTMLGVIIGVGAVLVVVAIGQGLKADVLERIRSMGTNLVTISPGGGRRHGPPTGQTQPGKLIEEDLEALQQDLTNIAALAPTVQKGVTAKYRNLTHTTQAVGTNSQWPTAMAFEVAEGRFFSSSEQRARARVAVVGQEVVDELFYGRALVGEYIRINNTPFEVIGILEEKGGGWGNPDNQIVMPLSTARQRLVGDADLNAILVSAANEAVVPAIKQNIERTLFRTHRVTEATRDFDIRDQTEMLSMVSETTGQMTLFLGGIAAVSLVVGGVGIMNIMLVSVVERTREIGIRKAVGARRSDIMAQFLIESVMLSALGGIIGIAFGFAGSQALGQSLGWQTVVPLWAVVLSFVFSAAVGIFFGWYPARKAALLDPIECLRYE